MKIKNTRGINERIMSYIEGRHHNSFIATAILLPISSGGVVFADEKTVLHVADQFWENAKRDGVEYTRDETIMAAMLLGLVRKHNVQGGQFPEALYDDITKNSRIFHKDSFAQDPYRKNIKYAEGSTLRYALSEQSYQPYELFLYNTPKTVGSGVLIPALAAFDCKWSYPCLKDGEKVLRSLTPYEIQTRQDAIEKAKGRVLVLGLKMGYYTYMAHRKESVEKVTVIEEDAALIEWFRQTILPQFEHPEKVEVIQADPAAYMESCAEESFDLCFVDLWENHLDAEAYFRIRKVCKRFGMKKMEYWIEAHMIETIMGLVFVAILEAFYENAGIVAPSLAGLSDAGSGHLARIREALQNEEITRPDHVDWFMDPENFMKLL